ncbi:MAG TPA: hypothetical protein PLR74_00680, partial [Agriterribacter sp.]|nr:hypothetical protein [Agriterribacter sp.]
MTLASNYSLMFIKCVAVVVLIAFTSCKKDDSEIIQPASSITGQWTGVLTKSGSTIGNLNIVILQNGTLEAQDTAGIKTADGT